MDAIDVHAHFGPYNRGSYELVDRFMSGSIDQVVARALACGIRYTVVSAIRALIPYGGDPLRGNEDAQAAAEKHSSAVRFWTVIDPRRKETYRQAEEQLKSSVCCGIKIHPVEHDYPITGHGDEIFEFANAHKAVGADA